MLVSKVLVVMGAVLVLTRAQPEQETGPSMLCPADPVTFVTTWPSTTETITYPKPVATPLAGHTLKGPPYMTSPCCLPGTNVTVAQSPVSVTWRVDQDDNTFDTCTFRIIVEPGLPPPTTTAEPTTPEPTTREVTTTKKPHPPKPPKKPCKGKGGASGGGSGSSSMEDKSAESTVLNTGGGGGGGGCHGGGGGRPRDDSSGSLFQ